MAGVQGFLHGRDPREVQLKDLLGALEGKLGLPPGGLNQRRAETSGIVRDILAAEDGPQTAGEHTDGQW